MLSLVSHRHCVRWYGTQVCNAVTCVTVAIVSCLTQVCNAVTCVTVAIVSCLTHVCNAVTCVTVAIVSCLTHVCSAVTCVTVAIVSCLTVLLHSCSCEVKLCNNVVLRGIVRLQGSISYFLTTRSLQMNVEAASDVDSKY